MLAVDEFILQMDASHAPLRLEYVRGRIKWEASPASRHQMAVRRIERSVQPTPGANAGCACFALADVLLRFADADQSLKRPDIAIFCTEPPEQDEALELVPAAVIEVISAGYEEKDTGPDGAPFYIAQGVADVLVFDPRTAMVEHYRPGHPVTRYATPCTFDTVCGCRVTVG
jgi:Uma2 family endonuclease